MVRLCFCPYVSLEDLAGFDVAQKRHSPAQTPDGPHTSLSVSFLDSALLDMA